MKKILFLVSIFAFSVSLTAQNLPTKKSLKANMTEAISKEKPNLDEQIKSALLKDEGLQKETINHLKSNPETAASLAGLATKGGGSNLGMIKSILGDKNLTAAAIDFISKNPELLQKAMKLVGM